MKGPRTGYRPTQDRVREAVFNSLAERIPGCRFVDLFAGSGTVGLEAASRGASSVVWVEQHPERFRFLQRAVRELWGRPDAARSRTIRGDALHFLEEDSAGPYDVIFADPPYDQNDVNGWLRNALNALEANPILAADGIFVMESAVRGSDEAPEAWTCIRDAKYGSARVRYYKVSA